MGARNWGEFALLLIDVQRDFWRPGMEQKFPAFESNVARLLELCRAERLDVLHIRARFKPDGTDWMVRYRLLGSLPCIDSTAGAEVLPCASERPGEPVIYKQTYDAFLSPAVPAWLERAGKRYLLVAGMDTAVCVLLTGAAAAQRGYLVAIVADCCADPGGAHDHVLARYPNVMERVIIGQIVERHDPWRRQLSELKTPAQQ
ncbi:MAG: cysteine hydrolase [Gammaproteobacteria bacterium]|nr:cysteine hydrolase [Gammaproteobacteria bacterium]